MLVFVTLYPMKCKLCNENKDLCKKSHIIPNFMYKEVFGEKHEIINISLKKGQKNTVFTGEFESNILCFDCDNSRIGKLETYGNAVLYGGKNMNVRVQSMKNKSGVEFTSVTGVDYKKFKLFLLSVLWRASISKRDFFKNINLGPYEEKIRKMILREDPGPIYSFPFYLSTYKNHDLPARIIGEPRKVKGGQNAYIFLINGFIYYFFITHKISKNWVSEITINETGELKVIHLPEKEAKNILNSFFGGVVFK